jgi:hypothetical protein
MDPSHFLVITDESYDCSMVHGIYDTFDAARDDIERRTSADRYFATAQIQEWTGSTSGRTWEREGAALNWAER